MKQNLRERRTVKGSDHGARRLLTSQAISYSETIYILAQEVFATNYPADRVVRRFFKAHKKFGSSDRRFISETLFSLFRWWGWLQKFIESQQNFWRTTHPPKWNDEYWLSIILGAHILDNLDLHPISNIWSHSLLNSNQPVKQLCGLRDKTLTERADRLRGIFQLNRSVDPRNLVPPWIFSEVNLAPTQLNELVGAFQKRPPIWLRIQCKNRDRLKDTLQSSGLDVESHPRISGALKISNARANIHALDSFKRGEFEIQDIASQIIGIVCNAKSGERWWDVCAGAGGKSLQLATMMKNKGTVLATDIRHWKLKDLSKRARRAHLFNIQTKPWDGKRVPAKTASFDGVLVDAPCSGTGTWRRNPDGRWTTGQEDVRSLASLQLEILTNAVKGVKDHGTLVYATCSLCKQENEDVIHQFLDRCPNFKLVPLMHPLTGIESTGMVKVYPYDSDCDAIFVTKMERA